MKKEDILPIILSVAVLIQIGTVVLQRQTFDLQKENLCRQIRSYGFVTKNMLETYLEYDCAKLLANT